MGKLSLSDAHGMATERRTIGCSHKRLVYVRPVLATSSIAQSNDVPPHGSRLERLGAQYLAQLAAKNKAVAQDELHILNENERRELRRIERGAVARAATAGALSGLVCAIPAIVMSSPPPHAHIADHARYYGILVAVIIVASVAEIAFLYWDGLRAVHQLAHAAGMDLSDPTLANEPTSALWALARAALESPNPPNAVPGVDPLREASKLRVFIASTLYKLKVAISGVLAKILVRRLLGRAATRAVLELLAVPVTALWDALVCWLIVREARLRVLGPSAAIEFSGFLLGSSESLSLEVRECSVRAIGAAAVRSEDLHPNLVALLAAVKKQVKLEAVESIDDTPRFLKQLAALKPEEQTTVLRVLAAASIIDGRLARDEQTLLEQAWQQCGRTYARKTIERLRKNFVSGDAIRKQDLEAVQ